MVEVQGGGKVGDEVGVVAMFREEEIGHQVLVVHPIAGHKLLPVGLIQVQVRVVFLFLVLCVS